MHVPNPNQSLLQMIETNVKSAIPWSKRNFDFESELEHINNSMLKTSQIESRIRDIQFNIRQKAMEREKILNSSLNNNQQRKNDYLSLKKRKMSLHSKKVNDKLMGYYTTQKNEYKKASLNQKHFADTVSSYWSNKNKEVQKRERDMYTRYQTEITEMKDKERERQRGKERYSDGQFMMTEVRDESGDEGVQKGNELEVRIGNVKSRMKRLDSKNQYDSFQKLMRKLSKIQCKKKLRHTRLSNTQGSESSKSLHYISSSPAPRRQLGTRIIREQPLHPHSTSLVYQRKKLKSKNRQNMEARKTLHKQMYNTHTRYLQGYKHRIKQIENLKQVKEKLIESKLFVERRERRSHSHV